MSEQKGFLQGAKDTATTGVGLVLALLFIAAPLLIAVGVERWIHKNVFNMDTKIYSREAAWSLGITAVVYLFCIFGLDTGTFSEDGALWAILVAILVPIIFGAIGSNRLHNEASLKIPRRNETAQNFEFRKEKRSNKRKIEAALKKGEVYTPEGYPTLSKDLGNYDDVDHFDKPDVLLESTAEVIVALGRTSIDNDTVSGLIKCGYNRTNRILKALQEEGVVGKEVNGIRKVLVKDELALEKKLHGYKPTKRVRNAKLDNNTHNGISSVTESIKKVNFKGLAMLYAFPVFYCTMCIVYPEKTMEYTPDFIIWLFG